MTDNTYWKHVATRVIEVKIYSALDKLLSDYGVMHQLSLFKDFADFINQVNRFGRHRALGGEYYEATGVIEKPVLFMGHPIPIIEEYFELINSQ